MDFATKAAVVPMRFYANWDVDRTSSSAVPRTLSMKFTRLCLTKTLATENTFIIAVKLQGYRRILRSNDIVIPSASKLDYALDISFTIQYCHYIKRKSNVLDIIIQRRKKYKNRQIPGFKTLAFGNINLDEVLQQGGSREVSMWDTACLKRLSVQDFHAGTIFISNCQSQVYDSVEQDTAKWVLKTNGKYGNVLSEEDVDDYSSPDDSDFEEFERRPRDSDDRRRRVAAATAKQRNKKLNQKNIKQKVVALLRKFRVPDEEEDNISNAACSTSSRMMPPTELELQEIFEELDNISDSGPELEPDKMSIVSNPRPGIRPFFGSKNDNLPAIKDDQLMHFDDSSVESDEPDQDQESSEETPKESCYWEQEAPPQLPLSLPTTTVGRQLSGFLLPSTSTADSFSASSCTVQSQRDKLKHSLTIHSMTSADGRPATCPGAANGGLQPSARSLALSSNKKSLDHTLFLNMLSKFDSSTAVVSANASAATTAQSQSSVVPSNIWLTSSADFAWISKVDKSRLLNVHLFDCPTLADVRSTVASVVSRIQKFCNSNSGAPSTTRIGVFGGDRLVAHVLRIYVDALQNKSCQEWLDYLRFCPVVLPGSAIGRLIGQTMDGQLEALWRGVINGHGACGAGNLTRVAAAFEGGLASAADYQELADCLSAAIGATHPASHQQRCLNLSIGEVMLQLESKSGAQMTDERDSSQIFVPLLSELNMGGSSDDGGASGSSKFADDYAPIAVQSSSPIVTSTSQNTFSTNISPPISPHSRLTSSWDCREVYVEYWTSAAAVPLPPCQPTDYFTTPLSSSAVRLVNQFSNASTSSQTQSSSKFSMKATVRNLSVAREPSTNQLCILFAKEKRKDKVLQKLGRKPKQRACNEADSRLVSGVTRMVCSSGGGKNAVSLDVSIDGVAWRGIRYFQVSAQWQTHVKLFPICYASI